MLEGRHGFGVWAIDDLVFLRQEAIPEFLSQLTGLLDDVAQVIGIWWPKVGSLKVSSERIFELLLASDRVFV
jgi:hypothetical protein